MYKFIFKLLILAFVSGIACADTKKYVCSAFDNDSQSEYEWNIAITQVEGDIYDLQGSAPDNSWNYLGHGFKKDNEYYFYWKMVETGSSGLVHYVIENDGILTGNWIAEDSKTVLAETCRMSIAHS